MTIFTYSQARQNFATVLDIAKKKGGVLIKRKDGTLFSIHPEKLKKSMLDVKGINSKISTKEIVAFVRESRER